MTRKRGITSARHTAAARARAPAGTGSATSGAGKVLPSGPLPTSLSSARLVPRDEGVLLLLDGTESSFIDLRDPTHLDFEYQQQMDAVLSALTRPDAPVRAVHLGAAGCALARAWDAARPGSRQLAVEIDRVLARQVREWFDLPRSPRLRIRVGDAAQVVGTLRGGAWDVVVRDVFAAGQVPDSCRTRQFLASCAAALAPWGIVLVNTPSVPRPQVAAEVAALTGVFDGVLLIADAAVAAGRRRGNLVAVARREPFSPREHQDVERVVRRLPLPVRTWEPDDPVLPRP